MAALSPDQLARLAHEAGFRGRDLEVAVAVALAESSGRPGVNAHGPEDSRGLWQINSVHFGRLDEGRLYEPEYNARAAFSVWRESHAFRSDPWDAWTVHANGSYRQYLPQARRAVGDRSGAGGGSGRTGPGGGDGGPGRSPGGGGRGHGGGLRPWQVPRNGPGRTGRVVYSLVFLGRLASRFTEYLAVADQVDRRCRQAVDELNIGSLVLAGPFEGELRRRAHDAVADEHGTRRLPRLLARDVGFLIEFRRRVRELDADRAFGPAAIGRLLATLPPGLRGDRSRRRVGRLLRQLAPDRPAPQRLPTTVGGVPRLDRVSLTPALRGTRSIFEQFVTPFMRRQGLEPGSTRRDHDTVDGPRVSDHFEGVHNAYAVDYPTGNGEGAARALAQRMGNPDWRPNTDGTFHVEVDGHRFRVQILWGSGVGHVNHVHVGVKRLAEPAGATPITGGGES